MKTKFWWLIASCTITAAMVGCGGSSEEDDGGSGGSSSTGTGASTGTGGSAMCGNGVVDTGEDCDDMGESATCNADCTTASCGDGTVNATAGEDCDDTGESATCNADCTAASCGDGQINMAAGETCDDMGESATCDSDCTAPMCGDGVTNMAANEDCDDMGESAMCDPDCTSATCGDGTVNNTAGETCDDMGESSMCDNDCTAVTCGDGIVNMTAGEMCDGDGAGMGGETATCDIDCTTAMCGDGSINATAGETCDDMGETATCDIDCTAVSCGDGVINMTAGETCDDMGESATCDNDCSAAQCGDGLVNMTAGETCDDSGESATCDDDCTAVLCGDSVLNATAGEQCDDGNTVLGDGCDANCQLENICTTPVLGTNINSNNGSSGNFFEIQATNAVTITGFDINIDPGLARNIEVWVREGTYTGFTDSNAGWNQVGTATVTSAGIDVPTALPIDVGVTIPAGATYAFHLVSTNSGWNYVNGTTEGNVWATDANITIFEGRGAGSAFPASTFNPRNFSGNIYYRPAGITTFAGGNGLDGNMFDVSASATGNVHVKGLNVNLGTGTHNLELWTKRGTYVGSETTQADWTLLGTANGITSFGSGQPTPLPIGANLLVPAGETMSFYVTTDGTLMNYTNGTQGATLATLGDLSVLTGAGVSYPFASSVAGRSWNGAIDSYNSAELSTAIVGGNSNAGNMFDVQASGFVRITGFQQSFSGTTARDVEIYFKTGSHVGFETNPNAWTLIGSQAGVVPDGTNDLTPLLIPIDIPVDAGQTVAFYITGTGGGNVAYTNGTAVGNTLSTDGTVTILEGVGKGYPFGATNTPRNWNGAIYYSDCD